MKQFHYYINIIIIFICQFFFITIKINGSTLDTIPNPAPVAINDDRFEIELDPLQKINPILNDKNAEILNNKTNEEKYADWIISGGFMFKGMSLTTTIQEGRYNNYNIYNIYILFYSYK